VTAESAELAQAVPARWLRTSRHPSAHLVPGARTFDYLYAAADDIEDVYRSIVEELVAAAGAQGHVLYAVPGSPSVAERSVELLRADPRVTTTVYPGVSFADIAFERMGTDPLASGVRIVDGHRFAVEVAGHAGPLLVGQCDSPQVLSEVKLAIGAVLDLASPPAAGPRLARDGGAFEVTVLASLGLPEESVRRLAWYDLDREVVPDHLTSLWVPSLGLAFAPEIVRLEQLARVLREQCPWDRQQTHQSLTRYMLEECYEAVEAIEDLGEDGEGYEHLEEELGDVLFQVVFHSVLAAEAGQFYLADVARNVHDKLVGRHPHVFGDVVAATPGDVARNWERLKQEQRGPSGPLDGLPRNLPALLRAYKVQSKAAAAGLDLDGQQAPLARARAALAALERRRAGEGQPALEPDGAPDVVVGDLLFCVVALARSLGVDPEAALVAATTRAVHGAAPGKGAGSRTAGPAVG